MSATDWDGDGESFYQKRSLWYVLQDYFRDWRKYIPHLVWEGDEIDVDVTLTGINVLFPSKHLWEVEGGLADLGVDFPLSSVIEGRKWYWRESLTGPISIKFKGLARRPEARK